MRPNPVLILVLVLIVAGIAIFGGMFYTVSETEQAILTRFGKPRGQPVNEAGLHVKAPFVDKVHLIEKRILEWDGESNEIATKDKLFILVDSYGRWRVSDPLLYYQRLRNERSAQSRLDDILDGETRNAIARHDLIEIIRTQNRVPQLDQSLQDADLGIATLQQIQVGRESIEADIHRAASARLTDLGIELLDIRFKRINYNQTVQNDIYSRMISERKQIAEKFRSEGEGSAARIRGEMQRELNRIESEAYKEEQRIRGDADAKAIDIYARAYNQTSQAYEFYKFTKTLETYQTAIDPKTTVVFSTESELFRYLTDGGGDFGRVLETGSAGLPTGAAERDETGAAAFE
jgi:membrane protease subunit HflC